MIPSSIYALLEPSARQHPLEACPSTLFLIRKFDSSADLIAACRLELPDLVVLAAQDAELLDRYREIRGSLMAGQIPVLCLAASPEACGRLLDQPDFAGDCLNEPFIPEVLSGRMQRLLRNTREQAVLRQKLVQLEKAARGEDGAQAGLDQNLEQLLAIGLAFGVERDRVALLRMILQAGRDLSNCDAGTLFLRTEQNTLRFELRTQHDHLPVSELPLYDPESGEPIHRFVATHAALTGETVVIDDVYTETRFDLSGTKRFSAESGMRSVSMLAVPMRLHNGECVGVLQFVNAKDRRSGVVVPFAPSLVRTLKAIAAQAAVALENLQLIEAQKALMDSLIRLIAGAIDAKSPYTGGHNERVPELAFMLAQAASEVREGPLADFGFATSDEWREFRIGAWLHDCGKVTSPEYVVDKATKLETIHNRIHEIRTRFEVLLRDARIEALEKRLAGESEDQVRSELEACCAALADDFVFLAECNLGGEFMAPERIERLKQIAGRSWLRHFDDRLGLSEAELKRYPAAQVPLPAREFLLADKPEHLIQREAVQKHLDEKYGFRLKVPEYLYNHGELYNLSIGRGTLTDEERFKINEHIIQTIVMLENLPLPKNLKRVPEYAGTHHEALNGRGYPRGLAASNMSVPARIMAIADIFEALTAPDRPYKKTKTLSECVHILSFFKKDGHIDPVLFDLFLESGIYQTYAERFMLPEQVDAVDIGRYLG